MAGKRQSFTERKSMKSLKSDVANWSPIIKLAQFLINAVIPLIPCGISGSNAAEFLISSVRIPTCQSAASASLPGALAKCNKRRLRYNEEN
jgi:hypothetical protein